MLSQVSRFALATPYLARLIIISLSPFFLVMFSQFVIFRRILYGCLRMVCFRVFFTIRIAWLVSNPTGVLHKFLYSLNIDCIV